MRRSAILESQADLLLASDGIPVNPVDPVLDRAVPLGVRLESVSDMFRRARALIPPRHDEHERLLEPVPEAPGFTQADLRFEAMQRGVEMRRWSRQREVTLVAATRQEEASIRERLGKRRVNPQDGRKRSLWELRGESDYRLAFA